MISLTHRLSILHARSSLHGKMLTSLRRYEAAFPPTCNIHNSNKPIATDSQALNFNHTTIYQPHPTQAYTQVYSHTEMVPPPRNIQTKRCFTSNRNRTQNIFFTTRRVDVIGKLLISLPLFYIIIIIKIQICRLVLTSLYISRSVVYDRDL